MPISEVNKPLMYLIPPELICSLLVHVWNCLAADIQSEQSSLTVSFCNLRGEKKHVIQFGISVSDFFAAVFQTTATESANALHDP